MTQDLSTIHELVSDLFHDAHQADPEQYRLSDEQVQQFHDLGYVHNIKVLEDHQIQALRTELATFIDPDHPGHELWYEYNSNESTDPNTVLFHALGAWRITPGFHDLLWHPAITVPASQLLDGSVRFWHDQLFCKPAKHGGVVAWHQDYSYWTRTKPLAHLTCWLGLDPATTQNGCMYYVPESHKWPLLPITGLAGDMQAVESVLNDEQKKTFQNKIPIELPPGHASFHHPLMMHGSYANDSDLPRRAVVVNMFKDGTLSDANETLLHGVPPIPKDQKMQGQFFPLIRKA